MKEKIKLTLKGKQALEIELNEINNVKLPEAEKRLNEARSLGDLSENAEYDAAKEEMSTLTSRQKEIRDLLDNCEVIDSDQVDSSTVSFGVTVKVHDLNYNEDLEYMIVSEEESDIDKGKISERSPLALALIGHKIGETVEYEAPAGTIKVKIKSITK